MPVKVFGLEYASLDELRAMFPPKLRPSLETVRRAIREKRLRAVKFGPTYLISETAIKNFLAPSWGTTSAPAVRTQKPNRTRRRVHRARPDFTKSLAKEAVRLKALSARRKEHNNPI